MSFLLRQVAHCDVCGHEWIVIADKTPSHCAKCKSRKWNKDGGPFSKPIERVYDSEGFRHALDCECLMCRPPERTVEYEE